MRDDWQYQLRLYLPDALVEDARSDPGSPALAPLGAVLTKHGAAIKSQFDAFSDYVAAAETHGVDEFPLYAWTKATIEDPVKRAKHLKSFALHVGGREIYGKAEADALEADLRPLVGGLIERLSKHDTNPANNPQPPEEYRPRRAP
ncbi:hypothetical protein OPKNFCMD_6137 [Methylobacterium crusticola]|uniref:Uncharacterized protein n=1 Tax=Methylobacterium crusticola TaxID=1697972 RepID=A0ABQ4R9G6_9HYPH|nr:hypothetical protein [Methylobacterium crusticola]GJD53362.1 hypothetical protein OPKNFCMD_6137 [Methylobacterium crusticola]